MDNREKLVTQEMQDEEKQNKTKNTTQYVLYTTMHRQTKVQKPKHNTEN